MVHLSDLETVGLAYIAAINWYSGSSRIVTSICSCLFIESDNHFGLGEPRPPSLFVYLKYGYWQLKSTDCKKTVKFICINKINSKKFLKISSKIRIVTYAGSDLYFCVKWYLKCHFIKPKLNTFQPLGKKIKNIY